MPDPGIPGNVPGQPPTPPPPPPLPPPPGSPHGGASGDGPQPVPSTPEEALEIGRRHFPAIGSSGGPSGLFVHEFDVGYLVHASWPPPEDPQAPPTAPGGSNVAISKINGDVTFLPNHPPEEAVKIYHRWYRPGTP